MKIWDVAGMRHAFALLCSYCEETLGQPRFRSMWEKYCSGVDAMVSVPYLSGHNRFIQFIDLLEDSWWTRRM